MRLKRRAVAVDANELDTTGQLYSVLPTVSVENSYGVRGYDYVFTISHTLTQPQIHFRNLGLLVVVSCIMTAPDGSSVSCCSNTCRI